MELVCIDKQTFEELRVRFCEFEDRVTRLCRPVEDLGLKNWLDNQEVVFLQCTPAYPQDFGKFLVRKETFTVEE